MAFVWVDWDRHKKQRDTASSRTKDHDHHDGGGRGGLERTAAVATITTNGWEFRFCQINLEIGPSHTQNGGGEEEESF